MITNSIRLALSLAAAIALAGCASSPKDDPKLEEARVQLEALKANENVQTHAPAPLLDAEQALNRAESAHEEEDKTTRDHQYYLAQRYMETAKALTETGVIEEDTKAIGREREQLAIAAREKELESAQARSKQLESELAALEAKRTERGMLVTLDDVFFETAGATVASGADRSLDRVANFLKKNPDQQVIIEGHTDSLGTASYNQRLSEQRADAVKREILARGVEPDRVQARGFGESRPVTSNASPAGRQLNRRVEVVFPENHS